MSGRAAALRLRLRRSRRSRRLRVPLAAVAPAVLGLVVLLVCAASLVAPTDPNTQDLLHLLEPPSAAHLFGTDVLGRDVLSRVLWGGWPPLAVGACSVLVALVVGTAAGVAAGARGGLPDAVLGRVADIQMSIPGLVLALLALALFGSAASNLVLIIAFES